MVEIIPEYQHYSVVDSTNSTLRTLALKGAKQGLVVTADEQRAGKGQRNNGWASPEGKGLYYSILFTPQLEKEKLNLFTLMAGIAVHDCLKGFNIDEISLKWPNDILIAHKKVGGILTECNWSGTRLTHCIVGVGINVQMEHDDFPKDILFPATSLHAHAARTIEINQLIEPLTNSLIKWYAILEDSDGECIVSNWLKRTDMIGRDVVVIRDSGSFNGTVKGLTPEGHLLVSTEYGDVSLLSGMVRY